METEQPVPEDLPGIDMINATQLLTGIQTREFQESLRLATRSMMQMLTYMPLDHPRRDQYTALFREVDAIYEKAKALAPSEL